MKMLFDWLEILGIRYHSKNFMLSSLASSFKFSDVFLKVDLKNNLI